MPPWEIEEHAPAQWIDRWLAWKQAEAHRQERAQQIEEMKRKAEDLKRKIR